MERSEVVEAKEMGVKNSRLTIAINEWLKFEFFRRCKEAYVNPSEVIREFILWVASSNKDDLREWLDSGAGK